MQTRTVYVEREGKERIVEKVVEVVKEVEVEKLVKVQDKLLVEVQVESEQHKAIRSQLEEYNKSVIDQRNQMGRQLEANNEVVRQEREAKTLLEAKLAALQAKVMGGGRSPIRGARAKSDAEPGGERKKLGDRGSEDGVEEADTAEKALARQAAEYKRAQLKLKAQKRAQAKAEREKKALEAEKAEAEAQLLEREVEQKEQSGVMRKMREKYKKRSEQQKQEIEDLTEEFQSERETYLTEMRRQNKEIQLYEQIAALVFSSKEIGKVWERAKYDEETETWILPRIKPRTDYAGNMGLTSLPTLGGGPPGSAQALSGGSSASASAEGEDGQETPVGYTAEQIAYANQQAAEAASVRRGDRRNSSAGGRPSSRGGGNGGGSRGGSRGTGNRSGISSQGSNVGGMMVGSEVDQYDAQEMLALQAQQQERQYRESVEVGDGRKKGHARRDKNRKKKGKETDGGDEEADRERRRQRKERRDRKEKHGTRRESSADDYVGANEMDELLNELEGGDTDGVNTAASEAEEGGRGGATGMPPRHHGSRNSSAEKRGRSSSAKKKERGEEGSRGDKAERARLKAEKKASKLEKQRRRERHEAKKRKKDEKTRRLQEKREKKKRRELENRTDDSSFGASPPPQGRVNGEGGGWGRNGPADGRASTDLGDASGGMNMEGEAVEEDAMLLSSSETESEGGYADVQFDAGGGAGGLSGVDGPRMEGNESSETEDDDVPGDVYENDGNSRPFTTVGKHRNSDAEDGCPSDASSVTDDENETREGEFGGPNTPSVTGPSEGLVV
jgi:hypothetical protein